MAKHAVMDHRTDVYSLGATLYELLTLNPPFESEDRQELLRQITLEEPRLPRRSNKAIPTELETIVLKAIAKNPGERYVTAGDLAHDLRRWLEDRPIRARRSSVWTSLARWGRRHRTFVVSAAAALVMGLAVLAGCIGWVVGDQQARQEKRVVDIRDALREAAQLRAEGKLTKAQAQAKRAETLLNEGVAPPELADEVQKLLRMLAEEEADSQLVALLEKLRLRQADINVKENHFLIKRARPDYQQAFRSYGMCMETMAPDDAAEKLRSRPVPVRATLVTALDHWLILARFEKGPEAEWLERVLDKADPDEWRLRLRTARINDDRQALEQLAKEVDPTTQPPEALVLLAFSLEQREANEAAVAMLRRAQRVYPTDFWIN
jgi:tetratricopeptide (TPR) repeat protein